MRRLRRWRRRVQAGAPSGTHSYVAFSATEAVHLDPQEARKLALIANMNARVFSLDVDDSDDLESPTIEVAWNTQLSLSRLIWATRGLLAVLHGDVQLARCAVGWQRGRRKGEKCGRVFVYDAPPGHPRSDYCSEACKKRRNRRSTVAASGSVPQT